jgi:hypothetical protein
VISGFSCVGLRSAPSVSLSNNGAAFRRLPGRTSSLGLARRNVPRYVTNGRFVWTLGAFE